jgi:hypothetical protein
MYVLINPLKTKCVLHNIYKNSVRTSQETRYVTTTNPHLLILFREQSRFTVWTIRNTQIQYVRRMRCCGVLKHVENIITTRSKGLMSESEILLFANLYAKAIEAVKSRVVLSASFSELIWILCKINSEAKPWNRSQFVNLSTGSESFLVLIWSSKWNTIGKLIWAQNVRDNDFWQQDILVHNNIELVTVSLRRVMSGTLWCWNFKRIYMQ